MSKHKNKVSQVSDAGSPAFTEDAIRERAYQLFEQRGCQHGHDLEDWLQAEAEVTWKSRAVADLNTIAR